MLIAFPYYIVDLHTYREDPGTLLKHHCASLLSDDDEDVRRITVRRKYLLQDTLRTLRRIPWDKSKHLKVIFIGEPGVDDGGPRREYFQLLLQEIGRNNMYFRGSMERRLPAHNVLAIQDDVYFHIGQIIALSLVHDGPCVKWLAPAAVNYILGCEETLQVDDIPDPDIARTSNSS